MRRPVFATLASLSVLTLLAAATPTLAQCSLLETGQWGGVIGQAEYKSGYLYVGVGAKFVVLNVSNPDSPRPVAELRYPGLITSLVLGDDHVYVSFSDGLRVIDISDPTAPRDVGAFRSQPYDVRPNGRLKFWQGYIYVEDGWNTDAGTLIFDVRDPTAPTLAGRLDDAPFRSVTTIADGLAYSAAGASFGVWDLSEPLAPRVVGQHGFPDTVRSIAVVGGYAYVAVRGQMVQILNVSDPANPVVAGAIDQSRFSRKVAAADGKLFVEHGDNSLFRFARVFQLADPTAPVQLAEMLVNDYFFGLIEFEGSLLVFREGGGIRLLTLDQLPDFRFAGLYLDGGGVYAGNVLATDGAYTYLAQWNFGLKIIDVSSGHRSELVGTWELPNVPVSGVPVPDRANELQFQDSHAYLLSEHRGWLVLDCTDPTSPVHVATFEPDKRYLATASGFVYLANADDLEVFDVANPALPVLVGQLALPNDSIGIRMTQRFLMVRYDNAPDSAGYDIVDVSSPSAPAVVGTFEWPLRAARDVGGRGDYLYIVGRHGLSAIDISDVSHPVAVRLTGYFEPATSIEIVGELAYLSTDFGFYVLDLANPLSPQLVARYEGRHHSVGSAVADDFVALANSGFGFTVIGETLPGDLDGDGVVTLDDLVTLLANYGAVASATPEQGDVNRDGTVDLADLSIMLANLGETCS